MRMARVATADATATVFGALKVTAAARVFVLLYQCSGWSISS
jgi:hypothetical protein